MALLNPLPTHLNQRYPFRNTIYSPKQPFLGGRVSIKFCSLAESTGLTDNGPGYVARDTVSFARSLGFDFRTTPAYSPESNGMTEAFVKTFKRDYVPFSDP